MSDEEGPVRGNPDGWASVFSAFPAIYLLLFVVCLTGNGCNWLRQNFYRGQSPPTLFHQQVSREQIIQAVNANSQAIRSLQARVQVRATGAPVLSGDLSVEQPSRLRMQVGLLNMSNSGIDVGSNDDEFWVWIKSSLPGGQPPSVLYARHDDYERSAVKQALPIEPSWVIDSLGLAYFDPRSHHEGPFPHPDGSLEIRSFYQSASGAMVKATRVDPRTSVVVAQELYRNGIRIASSRAEKHQYFDDLRASIPRRVEIEIGLNTPNPGKVTLELSNLFPNSIDASYAGLWEMPRPRNIDMVNIAAQPAVAMPGTAAGKTGPPPLAAPAAGGNQNVQPGSAQRSALPVGPRPDAVPGNPIGNSRQQVVPATFQGAGRQPDFLPRGFGR